MGVAHPASGFARPGFSFRHPAAGVHGNGGVAGLDPRADPLLERRPAPAVDEHHRGDFLVASGLALRASVPREDARGLALIGLALEEHRPQPLGLEAVGGERLRHPRERLEVPGHLAGRGGESGASVKGRHNQRGPKRSSHGSVFLVARCYRRQSLPRSPGSARQRHWGWDCGGTWSPGGQAGAESAAPGNAGAVDGFVVAVGGAACVAGALWAPDCCSTCRSR